MTTTPKGQPETLADIIQLVQDYQAPSLEKVDIAGTEAVIVTHAKDQVTRILQPEDVAAWADRPRRAEGFAQLSSAESLERHLARHGGPSSALFLRGLHRNPQPHITAIYDYHEPSFFRTAEGEGEAAHGAGQQVMGDPAFCGFGATYHFPESDEIAAWRANNCKPMSAVEFGLFLEDRIVDIASQDVCAELASEEQKAFLRAVGGVVADPSTILSLALGLKVQEDSTVKEVRSLSSGEGEVTFLSQHSTHVGAQKVTVPNVVALFIPLFFASKPVLVLARLRYRKKEGGVVFFYDLWRVDEAVCAEARQTAGAIAAAHDVPLYLGRHSE